MQHLSELTRSLGIAGQLFRTRMDTLLTSTDVTYNQFSLLMHLAYAPSGQSISEIADAFEIQQPGISKMVRKLEDLRLVRSSGDPSDVRRKLISITDHGRKTIGQIQELLGPEVTSWFEGWTDAEAAALAGFLDRFNQTLKAN